MSNIFVLYGSRYGSTRRYAEMIAKELSAQCKSVEDVTKKEIETANLVIYGGGVYAGKLMGKASIQKFANVLLSKQMIVFSCGCADTKKEENRQKLMEYIENSIGTALYHHADCFCLRGDLLYSNMSFMHRMMMKMMVSSLKKQANLDEEAQRMIRTYGQDTHFVNAESIQELVQCAMKKLEMTDED